VITKCIDSLYFIVGFVQHCIHCDPEPQRFVELMPLWVAQCLCFCWWYDVFSQRRI